MSVGQQSAQAGAGGGPRPAGTIRGVNGPVVEASEAWGIAVGEMVEIGHPRLLGEVIRLEGPEATIQVYESTSGLAPGEPIYGTGLPLAVELGPGLIGTIFDGLQRPLEAIEQQSGAFIRRGERAHPLDRGRRWHFTPVVKTGVEVAAGDVLGEVPETASVLHRVLVPPHTHGRIVAVAEEGEYTLDEPIARLATAEGERQLVMFHRWPIRRSRPYRERLLPSVPLVTGQRVIDTFFPIAKGGTAALPGGFGTGKTVTQHQLAKWSDADVIVYVGCGERGNEMTDVLVHFPSLQDPRTGRPLMERTVLIANTSNMPVAAREASVYTGITIAEYFRDMGYHVAVMADSTSRWAEALREISARLEEMPAEEGFPAYLPSRLADFYERAGRVATLGGCEGSVSVIGAVSPPGGTFSEPVTIHTQRFTRCFWALDRDLAASRHFPAISWTESYSGYVDEVQGWWQEHVDPEWRRLRDEAMGVLLEEGRLQNIVRLVGPDALPDDQRLVLEVARMLREGFLQQNALDPVDTFCTPARQLAMLRVILRFREEAADVVRLGAPIMRIRALPVVQDILRMRFTIPNEAAEAGTAVVTRAVEEQLRDLAKQYVRGTPR